MSDLTTEMKQRIDSMSMHALLSMQLRAPIGDPFYQGESGEYAMKRLGELRSADPAAYSQASKDLTR